MTLEEAYKQARGLLLASDIEEASLEAEILLRETLNINRAGFYTELNSCMGSEQKECYRNRIDRRLKNEPLAYITGHREFYGLDFYVNPSVLIPRPETELLVESTIEMARHYESPVIADIGTGSGNISVSLAKHIPEATIIATDISVDALEVAALNCQKHSVEDKIRLLHGNLLEPLDRDVDIIVSNLPYVTTTDVATMNTAGYEPQIALDGGEDGLDTIRKLCNQSKGRLKEGGSLLLEIGQGQDSPVISILKDLYPDSSIERKADFNGIYRIISMIKSLT